MGTGRAVAALRTRFRVSASPGRAGGQYNTAMAGSRSPVTISDNLGRTSSPI
jgi:hypothetical protein